MLQQNQNEHQTIYQKKMFEIRRGIVDVELYVHVCILLDD